LYVLIHIVEATFNNVSTSAKALTYIALWTPLR